MTKLTFTTLLLLSGAFLFAVTSHADNSDQPFAIKPLANSQDYSQEEDTNSDNVVSAADVNDNEPPSLPPDPKTKSTTNNSAND